MLISSEQAKAFAAILSSSDIKAYINANRKEYEKFIAQEGRQNLISSQEILFKNGAIKART